MMNDKKHQLVHCTFKIQNILEKELKDYNSSLTRKYQYFFQSCLPRKWKTKAVLADISDGVWTVYVKNSVDAFQLRYLSAEICLHINKKMNKPAVLKIKIDSRLWKEQKEMPTIIPSKNPRNYSQKEAERIIQAFYTRD